MKTEKLRCNILFITGNCWSHPFRVVWNPFLSEMGLAVFWSYIKKRTLSQKRVLQKILNIFYFLCYKIGIPEFFCVPWYFSSWCVIPEITKSSVVLKSELRTSGFVVLFFSRIRVMTTSSFLFSNSIRPPDARKNLRKMNVFCSSLPPPIIRI